MFVEPPPGVERARRSAMGVCGARGKRKASTRTRKLDGRNVREKIRIGDLKIRGIFFFLELAGK